MKKVHSHIHSNILTKTLCWLAFLIVCLCNTGLAQSTSKPAAVDKSTPAAAAKQDSVVSAANQSEISTPQLTPATEPVIFQEYIIRRGDSLSKIAAAHGISLSDLLAVNQVDPTKYIYPGQRLIIPHSYNNNASGNPGKVDKIIETALKYRGVRYQYGGISSRGIDCSGLVARVLGSQGMRLPHSAAALFRLGTPVTKDALMAGDLVFFKRAASSEVSHVGIYLGEGKFIHASSAGKKVRINDMISGYYAKRFAGARRIINDTVQ